MELKDAMKKILAVHGYSVSERTYGLFATKERLRIAIMYKAQPAERKDLSELIGIEADKKIFISPYSTNEELQNLAREQNVILWGREELERELGKAILADSEGSFFKEEKKEIFLKYKIKKEDAKLLAEKLAPTSLTLEFLPCYVYNYSCDVLEEGHLDIKKNIGVISINAVTGSYEVLAPTFEEEVPEEVAEHPKLTPQLTESRAFQLAKQAVIELNTKIVELKDERDATVIFERKELAPKEEAVALTHAGLYYLPVWVAKGKLGSMWINGVSGKVIREKLIRRMVAPDEKIEVV